MGSEKRRAREQFATEDAAQRAAGRSGYPGGDAVPPEGLGHGPLAAQFVDLADALFTVPAEAGVAGVLEQIVATGVTVVPGAELASVTLRGDDGEYFTPVETGELATRLDRLQYDTGEGPCLAATAAGGLGVVTSADLAADSRFPRFGPAAAELGAAAVLCTGLFPGGTPSRLGALNFYARARGGFDAADRDIALLLAAHAATAMAGVTAVTAAELRASHLEHALQSRDVIGQAKGVLMERRGYGPEEAFEFLRRVSQDLHVKVRDLANTIVQRRNEL